MNILKMFFFLNENRLYDIWIQFEHFDVLCEIALECENANSQNIQVL